MKAYEVYIGHIKIGSSSVRLRIFFEPAKFAECVGIIGQQLSMNIRQFRKRFKSLILRVIIYAIEQDRFIKYTENVLKDIQLKLSPMEEAHMADFSWINSIKNGYAKLFIGISIMPLVQAMQEFKRKNKYKARNLIRYVAHELLHYLDSPNIAKNAIKMYELMYEELRLARIMPRSITPFNGIDAVELATNMNYTALNLFLTRCRVEGLATYREREFTQQHRILAENVRDIWSEPVMLLALQKDTDTKLIREFIESTIPYQIGEHMCLIISLGLLAKRRAGEVRLIVNNEFYSLERLNELFSKADVFYVTRIPLDIWEHTLKLVANQTAEGFVRVYNAACNRLKLQRDNRIIDWEMYTRVKNILIRSSEIVKKTLREHGYEI